MGCIFFADDQLLCLKRCMWLLVECDHTSQTFVSLKNPVRPTFIRSPNPVVDYMFAGAEKKVYNAPHIARIIIIAGGAGIFRMLVPLSVDKYAPPHHRTRWRGIELRWCFLEYFRNIPPSQRRRHTYAMCSRRRSPQHTTWYL